MLHLECAMTAFQAIILEGTFFCPHSEQKRLKI